MSFGLYFLLFYTKRKREYRRNEPVMKDIYHEKIMDHYRSMRNRGKLAHPSFISGGYNPLCGDAIAMQGCVQNGMIIELKFEGSGCIIGQAAASMLADHVRGMTCNSVVVLNEQDMRNLIGIEIGINRLKCVLLPLETLQSGIQQLNDKR